MRWCVYIKMFCDADFPCTECEIYLNGRDEELAEKATPVKIVLGDKKQARAVLEKLLEELADDNQDNDIPF